MGAWEEQEKRTTRHRKMWTESQGFIFVDALQRATNEEEVKAAYIKKFSLPVRTRENHDLLVDQILFEFKYSVKFNKLEVTVKVVAQAIYYINRLFKNGRINEVKYLIVADKDEARIFKFSDFWLFYESNEYQWDDFRPSSPDPKLIQAIKESRLLDSNRVYELISQDDLQIFSSKIYGILSYKNKSPEAPQNKPNLWCLFQNKKLIFLLGFFLALISVGIIGFRYSLNDENTESSPSIYR